MDGRTVVAVFTVGDAPLEIQLPLRSIGLTEEAEGVEAWTGEKSRVVDGRLAVSLPVHGAALHMLT
ncbi:hypothetical protein [Arthrobacter sp. H5]|uniref:hypothetical protein n=1 Tax=Arthrobacter sp. H5 TaxID=1267973 RepID=UPI0012DCB54A|nr:hypothetical protein [Arthrobacter sp. H5]